MNAFVFIIDQWLWTMEEVIFHKHQHQEGSTMGDSISDTRLRKICCVMNDGNVEEDLQSFFNYKEPHGLPEPWVLNSMIVSLSYMPNQIDINLLNCNSLMRIVLALASDQITIPGSIVLKIILESRKLLDIDMFRLVFMHVLICSWTFGAPHNKLSNMLVLWT